MKRFLIVVTLLALTACTKTTEKADVAQTTGGDPQRGAQLVQNYGCQACHTISSLSGPRGVVGPPLDHIAVRGYIAGKLPNNAQTMELWLQDPQKLDPQNAMPNLGISPQDAKDLTAYLFTLK